MDSPAPAKAKAPSAASAPSARQDEAYDPREYWEGRLTAHCDLRGTGHVSFGKAYNDWLYRAKRRTLERAVADLAINDATVLDVGSGTGYFVDWYLRRGARVTGIDITHRSIELLRRNFPGDFRVLDIAMIDAPRQGSFDIVNVWDVFYHIVDDEGFGRALRFAAESVCPGGALLATDRLCATSDERIAEHVRLRCLATYENVLGDYGFELAGVHFLFRWLNRYITLPLLDGRLGWLYYWLDGRERTIPRDSLCLGVWRRSASS
jgi:SAM-dependent methyltransferase